MTERDKLLSMTGKSPMLVDTPSANGQQGGPGWWVAIGTLAGVVAILVLAIYFLGRSIQARGQEAQRQADQVQSLQTLASGNREILDTLTAAIKAGDPRTADAVLALINDNRRIHGCKTVESVDQLATAPTCTVVRPGASSTTPVSSTPPPSSMPPVPSREPPVTTTSTIPPAVASPCLLEVLGLRLIC